MTMLRSGETDNIHGYPHQQALAYILDIGQTLDRRVRGEVAGLLCFQSHCLTLRAECVSIST
jgi:hypothetical protein